MSLHFIDFEVFAHDWMCVIISPTHKTKDKKALTTVIVNDRCKLVSYYKKYKDEIFVGYNIRHYDQFIFKAILLDFNPKKVNDWIIVDGKMGWQFSDAFNNINLNIYDAMPELRPSLKKLEGFMGNNIEESEVDFLIDRKLTAGEIAETIKYCTHDVEQTIQVFMHNIEDFNSHLAVIKAFKLPLQQLSKTKAQLAAEALGAIKQERGEDEFQIEFPPTLKLDKYKHIKDWYENVFATIPHDAFAVDKEGNETDEKLIYKQTLHIDVAGVPHDFMWGGLHGARPKYVDEGQFLNMDVRSYYPSMMIEYGWVSRNVPDPKNYKRIYDDRIRYKAEKNPLQAPYKLILNASYGATKASNNKLYDPRQANCICVGGQLLLLDLIEKLEPYCDHVQSNTDGILVKLRNNREQVEQIANEWSKRTGMVLEFDEYTKVIQRDVNSYIIVAADGHFKSKGVVKEQNKLDYDLPIINEAIVNYFVKDVPLADTINACDELIKFQKIYRVSSKYNYAMHGMQKLNGKTFRVFSSRDVRDGCMRKVKTGGNPQKFTNTPEHCFIVNGNVNGMRVPEKLDKQFYIDMAQRRVNQFTGEDNK